MLNNIEEIKPFAIYHSQQAAKLLGLKRLTVQRYLKAGKIQGTKSGKEWRISGQSMMDYLGAGKLDIPAVQLEYALVSLDLDQPLKTTEKALASAGLVKMDNSPFYNLGASMIKRIATESPTRADLLMNLASFILETKGLLPNQSQ